MSSARKIIVQLAVSVDGYIARPDGDVEWLNRRPHKFDYGMTEFQSSVDTVLIGRKTYDWAVAYCKKTGMKIENVFHRKKAHFVFSRKPSQDAAPGVQFVSGPVKDFAQRLRATPGKNLWMMGGGELIASFLDAGEIDQFDLAVVPVLIGEGIPLIAPRHRDLPLQLLSAESFPDGVVRIRYDLAMP